MEQFLLDLRYAFCQLTKATGFTLTVVLTLALGIGATTAIFTLAYDVILKPLPYRNSEQIVMMEEQVAEFRDIYPTLPINANHFVMWQQNPHTVEAMSVMRQGRAVPLGLGSHPVEV